MRILFLNLLALFFVAGFSAQAQDCFTYFPQDEGTVLETTHFDKKDKPTGSSTLTILSKSQTGDRQQVDVRMEQTSPETDSVFVSEYAYICQDGKLYVDMKSYLGNRLSAYQNMEIEVDADKLEFPSNPKAGQDLPGGTVVASVTNNGIPIVKVTLTISDRKVEKLETIETPAGKFDCFKVTQQFESKVGFIKVKGQTAEWISEGLGVVRSESYNKRGKLQSYSMLTKVTK